jgi:hypothetical protein
MAARGVPGLIAVTALMGLAACGSVSAGSAGRPASASASSSKAPTVAAGTPAGGSLCADGQGADRVVVSRTASPRKVTLSGAPQVQALVAALCALPPMPAGQHCPAAPARSVRLVFTAGEQSFPPTTPPRSPGVSGHSPRATPGCGSAIAHRWRPPPTPTAR